MLIMTFNNLYQLLFVSQETLSQSVSQGEISDCVGRQDILSRALPLPEYPGRLRGVGYGPSQQDIFGYQKHSKKDETSELKMMIAQLYKKVNDLEASKQDKVPVEAHQPEMPTPDSARDSCTIASPEVINCKLFFVVCIT